MARPRRTITRILRFFEALLMCVAAGSAGAEEPLMAVRFEKTPGWLGIRIDGHVFATYVFRDDEIPRPYFCNLHAPCGVNVTRPHPLEPGDATDHSQLHPGLWLAFGDLNGNDDWRLKAPVLHVAFEQEPSGGTGRGSFAVKNRYLGNGGDSVVCEEICRYSIIADPTATTIRWDSIFTPAGATIVFGDQEEMGLGVRMAGAIAESAGRGGLLTNSNGLTTAQNVWGKTADWCDYSGIIEGQAVGITLAGRPENFRRCWWHARDYGFMAANPFGRHAMTGGRTSRVEVLPGEQLRLQFAVVVHNGRPGGGYDPAAALARELAEQ